MTSRLFINLTGGAQRTAPLDHLSNVTAAKQTRSERMPACAETRGKFKPRGGPKKLINGYR